MRILSLIKDKYFLAAPIFIVLFTFFLPISPSIKSIFLVCSLVFIVLTPEYNKHLYYTFNSIWGRAAVGFVAFVLIACLWSRAPYSMQWMMVGKYLKIIYLPILAVAFIHPLLRVSCIQGYLAAIFITCIVSLLKSKGIYFVAGDPGEVFYNHIITGFMVAFGSYLAGFMALRYTGWRRVLYVLLGLFTSYQVLFINTGRTGYLVYFILVSLLLVQQLSFKKAVLGILLFCGVMTLAYYQSTTMQNGINSLISDIKSFQQNKENTSLGYRVQFHTYAKSLFVSHPFIGIGTGGFKYSFSKDNPVPSWGLELTDPHSQYWMTLSEQGLIGLFLLLFFLCSLFISSFELNETRPVLLGILTAFSIGCLSDTILCYSTAGFILVLMSALSFGELIEKQAFKKDKAKELSTNSQPDSVNVIHVG